MPQLELPVSGLSGDTYATSAGAAESMTLKADALKARVLDHIARCLDGATDDEIQIALGLSGDTERPRRWELLRTHRIRQSHREDGSVRRRYTRAGRLAVVWEACR